jgi:succinyl-diaminopimelate desuccinylase
MSATLELVQQLIARRSVTPDDAGCQAMLAKRLGSRGFAAETLQSNGVTNSWLRRGVASPLCVFAGHTDVVPPGPADAWASEPFTPVIRNGLLYGRGASDMKSSIAALSSQPRSSCATCPTIAGRSRCCSRRTRKDRPPTAQIKLVDRLRARGETIDYCIVGEPTSVTALGDTIKNGRRGSLTGRLRVRGVQGHVAYPHLARNPVHELAPALAELATTRWDDGDAFFPATTFQVSNIRAGTGVGNVIPGTCEVEFNLRFAPVSSADDLMRRIEAILAAHRLHFDLDWIIGAQPFSTPPGALSDALATRLRRRPVAPPHCRPLAAPPTGGSSRRSATRSSSSARPTRRSIRSMNRLRSGISSH